jgi:hypothetical protein
MEPRLLIALPAPSDAECARARMMCDVSIGQCDAEAIADMEGYGFERDTVLAALGAGKRNAISAT